MDTSCRLFVPICQQHHAEHHADEDADEHDLKEWDENIINDLSVDELRDMIMVRNPARIC